MLAHELVEFINSFNSLKSHFVGIYAINTLPRTLKIKHFLICNTDTDSGSGKHWFVILRSNIKKYELFDSLGLSDLKQTLIIQNCHFNTEYLKFNKTAVQSLTSSSCGQFCLYFIIKRLHNLDLSFSEILNEIFESDTDLNENNVLSFLSLFNTNFQ